MHNSQDLNGTVSKAVTASLFIQPDVTEQNSLHFLFEITVTKASVHTAEDLFTDV